MIFDKYIGLKYKEKGRDFSGVDCYGLVRLIYKNEYKIDLPSFTEEYTQDDTLRIQELIAQYKEGWESVDTPAEGSIVLFKVLGTESHVGVVISPTHFVHVRENQDSVIESLDSPYWRRRKVGFYKFSEKKSALLNAVPHPLRTERYTIPIIPGTNLEQLASGLTKEFGIAEELKSKVTILLNGRVISEEKWQDTILQEGDAIEYRAVPKGSGTFRTLALLAIIAVAPQLAGYAEFAYMGTAGATIAGSTAVYTAAYAATVLAGSALINAISPIRPPVSSQGNDPGSAERQLMVTGGRNQLTPYSSIPVVLGKVKMTPPLGAVNYLTYENERDSYLSMLLVWGYGPLNIDLSTLKIGDSLASGIIDINDPTKYQNITLDRKTVPTANEKRDFNAIYGNDIAQVQTNKELICDGNPETSVTPGPWFEASDLASYDSTGAIIPINDVTVALHFPQGLRKIKIKGDGSGDSYPTSVLIRLEVSYNSGSTYSLLDTITVGGDTAKKDGFTFTKTYSVNANSGAVIRARRETGDNTEDNPDWRYYHTSVLQSVTFSRNKTPVIDPTGSTLAMSAIKINATEELNGNIDGISALVQTWCKIWNGSSWVDGATSNPAALFRYVLEHPANPRKITNASTQINLAQLQYFYQYCQTKGFEYNAVLGESRSVLDVLRDICAAGRASPALIDGKWTVIIDEVKPNVIQHFTPHNSWGFESSKALPKKPDGLRVTYYDQDQDYQQCEIIVYDIGKNFSNSTLFENISLPGVTKKSSAIDHARWHLAQLKLRPEIYTLTSDIEYLVCNRGDRVKVNHFVPMWGLGSGRIKNRLSATSFELDEDMPMQAGVNYMIRVRSSTGVSTTRTLVAKPQDGYYSQVDLTSSLDVSLANAGDLFLFGEQQEEAQDLLVLSVEPSANKSARLTLVDYGVNSVYNIFNDYLTLSENTVFEAKITLPPTLQIESFGNKIPQITGFVSDESVMDQISRGVFRYNISVSFVNASQLPATTESVEVQYDLLSSSSSFGTRSVYVPFQNSSASIPDVLENGTYKIRMRYISRTGKVGLWTEYSNHTVVGKTNPPSSVTGFTASSDKSSGQILLTWNSNPEVDVYSYEVRNTNSNWGANDSGRIFLGDSTRCFTKYVGNTSYYIKAVDVSGNYSVNSTQVSYTKQAVSNITDINYDYLDSALTSATITLSWNDVTNSEFSVDYYEVSYPGVIKTVKANSITLPADWVGDRLFTVTTVDTNGNRSSGFSKDISKAKPDPVTDIKAQVIDNTVMLYWTLPNRTSLPIDSVLIKKGDTWATAALVGEKKGGFTTINEIKQGTYTYWLAAVDTDGIESDPTKITRVVSDPPDFVYKGEYVSTFTGTKSSAAFDGTVLSLPVNTTETFQSHFTSRGWNTPQDQINANYPIFIQPTAGSGYYEEVFTFPIPLSSSRVILSYSGRVVSGSPNVAITLSLSLDGISYNDYPGATEVFGSSFRFVKVKFQVTEPTNKGLYEISQISVRCDSKLKNDAGNVDAVLSDASGTIVNFNKEFVDVQSITVSPSGTTAIIPVYDFDNSTKTGTYSITSNVCTVNVANHNLITGQNVTLFFSSGSGINGIYTITAHTANSFTVNMIIANTSGNCAMHSQSFRVYLFNNSGTRVSSNASWAIKGY